MDKSMQRESDLLLTEIISKLYSSSRSGDIDEAVKAHRAGNVGLLRLFLKLVHQSINFSGVRELHDLLTQRNVPEPERFISAERIALYRDLWLIVMDLKNADGDLDASGRLCFAVMADPSDRKLVESIITERWPGSMEQAQELLSEIKRTPPPLSSGSL